LRLVGTIVAVAALAGIYAAYSWVRASLGRAGAAAPACLELLGSTTTEENGVTYIIGNVRNGCDQKFSSVLVTFKLDRRDNSEFPEALASAYGRNLKPGDTWSFRTTLPVSKDVTYRFDGLSVLP
jgi:hypothetical protein